MQVSFSMAIGNEELMHECFPKHWRMGTARMKLAADSIKINQSKNGTNTF